MFPLHCEEMYNNTFFIAFQNWTVVKAKMENSKMNIGLYELAGYVDDIKSYTIDLCRLLNILISGRGHNYFWETV